MTKFSIPELRTASLNCLTEIVSLTTGDLSDAYRQILLQLLVVFIQNLNNILPNHTNILEIYANGNDSQKLFINRLGHFISSFLTFHLKSLEDSGIKEVDDALVQAHIYLILISQVDDDEIFKTCLEYWYFFSKDLYTIASKASLSPGFVSPGIII